MEISARLPSNKDLLILQAFRGIAACMVVVFHVSHSIFSLPKYWIERPFGDIFEFGHSGVEFFFVLSGFIIYMIHRRDIGQPSALARFVWKRLRRIYPTYWVVLLCVVPVFYFFESTGTGTERLPAVWIDSVLLLHLLHGSGQVLSVSWTLFHEVLFYGVFSLLILRKRLGAATLFGWLMVCSATYMWGAHFTKTAQFYFSPMHLLFAMGMISAWLIGTRRIAAPLLLSVLGATIFTCVAVAETYSGQESPTMSLGYGLGSAILLVGAVELERSDRLSVPQSLTFLGDASYSIYLVHAVVLSILAKGLLAASLKLPIPHGLIFIVLTISGIGVGLIFHLLIEAPMLNWLGRREVRGKAGISSEIRGQTRQTQQ